jgi:hypothetical protein
VEEEEEEEEEVDGDETPQLSSKSTVIASLSGFIIVDPEASVFTYTA